MNPLLAKLFSTYLSGRQVPPGAVVAIRVCTTSTDQPNVGGEVRVARCGMVVGWPDFPLATARSLGGSRFRLEPVLDAAPGSTQYLEPSERRFTALPPQGILIPQKGTLVRSRASDVLLAIFPSRTAPAEALTFLAEAAARAENSSSFSRVALFGTPAYSASAPGSDVRLRVYLVAFGFALTLGFAIGEEVVSAATSGAEVTPYTYCDTRAARDEAAVHESGPFSTHGASDQAHATQDSAENYTEPECFQSDGQDDRECSTLAEDHGAAPMFNAGPLQTSPVPGSSEAPAKTSTTPEVQLQDPAPALEHGR